MFNSAKNTVRTRMQPLSKVFSHTNPNLITIAGLLLAVGAGMCFASKHLFLGGAFIILSGFFDVLDGTIARGTNRTTPYGGFLDSVSDRYADAAILIGIMYGCTIAMPYPDVAWFWGAMALVGSFMVSYTRARAEAAGANAAVGLAERAERLIIIAAGAFTGYLNIAVFVVAIITHITIIQRLVFVKKQL
ncbi:MAG: Archaetidylinositol phosphate synthase [Candidatus Argoarchaeum ethanivorans]|uniref:Archaetidylinositol phosphate synthase n=1 Tax=Candidatus Argoarchaeum ethanivorans TaxID=2608793 RepID=A0A812A0G2_9EURY|nr:MAG: Archaetidylinositol phosphate synthase [Candidatus Argoarchaeum ethanivorans]